MPTLISSSDDLITIAVSSQKHKLKTVAVTLFLTVRIYDVDKIIEKMEGVHDIISLIASILDCEVILDIVDNRDGCVALACSIVADQMTIWDKIDKLQEEVYNPESELSTFNSSHKPCRVQVHEARPHYSSTQAVYREEKHLEAAARAAKQRFFQVAEEEIRARKVADRAFAVAEKSHLKLQQAFDMYTEVALDIKQPGNIERARAQLEKARTSVNEYVEIVSKAANSANKINRYSKQLSSCMFLRRTHSPWIRSRT
jgi:hypothetical protein